jgi:lysophospholipase L1-like esterase
MVHRLDRLRPQAYIVLDGWNEVAEQVGTPYRLGVNRQFFASGRRLHEYGVLTDKKGLATKPLARGGLDVNEPSSTEDTIGKTYVDNLERMHRWARAQGAYFIVMLQPEVSSRRAPTEEEKVIPRSDSHTRDYHALVSFAIASCKERGIPCIDINEQPEYQDSPETLFLDVVHLTAAGHRVVADIIKRLLREAK